MPAKVSYIKPSIGKLYEHEIRSFSVKKILYKLKTTKIRI